MRALATHRGTSDVITRWSRPGENGGCVPFQFGTADRLNLQALLLDEAVEVLGSQMESPHRGVPETRAVAKG
jgi:hypothetical protein